mgnify:CR=1 FL=1
MPFINYDSSLSRQIREKVSREGYTVAYESMQQAMEEATNPTDQVVAITTYLQSKKTVNKLSVACGVICTLSFLVPLLTWSLV